MSTNYVFGDYGTSEICFKKFRSGWRNISECSEFRNVTFPADYKANIVKGKLLELYGKDIDIFMIKLNEAKTPEQLKELLKTKLGSLGKTNNANVEDLFDDDQKSLTSDAFKTLEKITTGKVKRVLNTKFLTNAWYTLRGANKNIRNLNARQGAYLFAYFSNGKILEGASSPEVLEFSLDFKQTDVNDIHQRFEKAVNAVKDLGIANFTKIKDPSGNVGEAVLISLAKSASVADLNNLQKTFRDSFTADATPEKKGLVNIVKKFASKLQDLFKAKNGKAVKLQGYSFPETTTFEMYYSQEEIDIAREAMTTLKPKAKKDAKNDKDSKSKSKTASKSGSDKDGGTENKKPFGDTSLGHKLRRPNYKAKHPDTYKKASKAARDLDKDFKKNAATLLKASGEAIPDSNWDGKERLADVLRQAGLIEKANVQTKDTDKPVRLGEKLLGGKDCIVEIQLDNGKYVAVGEKDGKLTMSGSATVFENEKEVRDSYIVSKLYELDYSFEDNSIRIVKKDSDVDL